MNANCIWMAVSLMVAAVVPSLLAQEEKPATARTTTDALTAYHQHLATDAQFTYNLQGLHKLVANGRCTDCHQADAVRSDNAAYQNLILNYHQTRRLADWRYQNYFRQGTQTAQESKFWIGVVTEPAVETELQSREMQTSLMVKGGLKVTAVTDKSPAAAASIQTNDVLFQLDGKVLISVDQLIKTIAETKGKALEGTLIRNRKPIKFKVTPEPRPEISLETPLKAYLDDTGNLAWEQASLPGQYSWDLIRNRGTNQTNIGNQLPKDTKLLVEYTAGKAQPTMTLIEKSSQYRLTRSKVKTLPKHLQASAKLVLNRFESAALSWSPLGQHLAYYYQVAENEKSASSVAQQLKLIQSQIKHLTRSVEKLTNPNEK